ncbi:QRFP-like peptide receptor [Haliotis rufescens]|uniref:QRFP-like peptide receptor n=1 Tax=Haliotis rufescens TaxID=6454 RepID=UPI001EB02271|nr:QRFP-like peptide receptor [Haliotis rufescens]
MVNKIYSPGPSPTMALGNDTSDMFDAYELLNKTLLLGNLFYTPATASTIVLIVLYVPVLIIGLIGNVCMVIIVFTSTRLRSMTNLYLCNMAAADMAVCLICVPMAVGQAVYKVWIYGEFMCKITTFLQGVTVCASVFTITVLSLDRLLAIRHPMIFKRISNCKMAAKMISIIWVISFGVMSPLLVYRKTDREDIFPGQTFHFCHEDWPDDLHRQVYDASLFFIVYIIPGTGICISYGLIGKQLWTEDENLKRCESEISRGMSQRIMAGRKRVAKMLIALAVVFAICWLPYYIVSLYLDFQTEEEPTDFLVILPFSIFLGHTNSALNPILYFYTSKSFRKYLWKFIHCKRYGIRHDKPVELMVDYNPADGQVQTRASGNPLIRIMRGSNSSSRSGSLKFSRSSNTSLRSLYTDSNSSGKRRDPKCREHLRLHKLPSIKTQGVEEHLKTELNGQCVVEPDKHMKEIMDYTLNIPTTIQEESSKSRCSSTAVSPVVSKIIENICAKIDTNPVTSVDDINTSLDH